MKLKKVDWMGSAITAILLSFGIILLYYSDKYNGFLSHIAHEIGTILIPASMVGLIYECFMRHEWYDTYKKCINSANISFTKCVVDSPTIGKKIIPYHEIMNEIRENLKKAKEIWVLTRTGHNLIRKDFEDEFTEAINEIKNKDKVKIILLDPKGSMAKELDKHLEMKGKYIEDIEKTIKDLHDQFGNIIDIKTINYLPAWMMIFINPNENSIESSIIYVELAKFEIERPYHRPTFRINACDEQNFKDFSREFKSMWSAGATAKP